MHGARAGQWPAVKSSLLAAALVLAGCAGESVRERPGFDLAPFREMALRADCIGVRNELFLIDGAFVLWHREGNCPDAAYAVQLYGATVDNVLCVLQDSIAGPRQSCSDGRYAEMFEVIVDNLDARDLGLGPDHTVKPVPM